MLELFRSNAELLDQKSDITFRDRQEKIELLAADTLNDCTEREISNENSIRPQPIPFEQFLSICGKHYNAIEKAYETFKGMVCNFIITSD